MDVIGGETAVSVYKTENKPVYMAYDGYTFAQGKKNLMTYSMFLDAQKKEQFPGENAMKLEVTDANLVSRLLNVINPPKMYTDVSELESIVVYQG